MEGVPGTSFKHTSSSGAWESVLKYLTEQGFNAKTHASGPDMYGVTNLGVIKYFQEMPNAYRCRRNKPLTWILNGQGDHDTSELSDQSLNKISTTSLADMYLSSPSSSFAGQTPRRRKQRTNVTYMPVT